MLNGFSDRSLKSTPRLATFSKPPALVERLEQIEQRIHENPLDEIAAIEKPEYDALDHTACHEMWPAASQQIGNRFDHDQHGVILNSSTGLLTDFRDLHAGEISVVLVAHCDEAANIVGFEYMLSRGGLDSEPLFAKGGKARLSFLLPLGHHCARSWCQGGARTSCQD